MFPNQNRDYFSYDHDAGFLNNLYSYNLANYPLNNCYMFPPAIIP